MSFWRRFPFRSGKAGPVAPARHSNKYHSRVGADSVAAVVREFIKNSPKMRHLPSPGFQGGEGVPRTLRREWR